MDEQVTDIPENENHGVEPKEQVEETENHGVEPKEQVEENEDVPIGRGSISIAPTRFWNSTTIRVGVVLVALRAVDVLGQIALERARHRRAMERELWFRGAPK